MTCAIFRTKKQGKNIPYNKNSLTQCIIFSRPKALGAINSGAEPFSLDLSSSMAVSLNVVF